MVNDNTFALLGEKTVKIYSRPQLVYVPPAIPAVAGASVTVGALAGSSKSMRKKWVSKKEKAAMIAAGIDPDAGEKTPDVLSTSASMTSLASSAEPTPKYNVFSLSGKLSIQCAIQGIVGSKRTPVLLKLAAKDKLLIGFDDGSLQIIFCPTLVDPATVKKDGPVALQIKLGDAHIHRKQSGAEEAEKKSQTAQDAVAGTMAAILCDFKAHFVPHNEQDAGRNGDALLSTLEEKSDELLQGGNSSTLEGTVIADDISELDANEKGNFRPRSTVGIRTAFVCPWGACSGGPGLGYQFELVTLGSDHRIAHWGVRFKEGVADVVLMPHFADNTRLNTAVGNEQMNYEADETNNFDDSLQSLSIDRPPTAFHQSDFPMESDLLGVSAFHVVSLYPLLFLQYYF